MKKALEIRPMNRGELDIAVGWARDEGWNPGIDDADAFFAADPGGFLMGFVDGKPAASISVVRYGAGFGFLGFYIVHPDFRGKGHGLALWNAGMARLEGRTVGLDGVVAQQENYRKSGFVLAHNNIRYGGKAKSGGRIDPAIVPVAPSLLPAAIAYDRRFFADDRRTFIAEWLAGAASRTGLAFVESGEIRGYGVIRACGRGHKIGPLFADNANIAKALLEALAASVHVAEIFLDVPEPNRAAVALAEAAGLAPVFETARMYRGPAPDLPLGETFGITTFELG